MPRYDGKRKKQKQGPRLKKGVNGPASSQNAATHTGTDAFIGFDAFGTSFASIGGAAGASGAQTVASVATKKAGVKLPEFYSGDDRDVDFQLKKLAKRDGSTRKKALEFLLQKMKAAPRPLLRATFRHVLYEYNRLCLSNDHQTRRLAHQLLACYEPLKQAVAKLRFEVAASVWLGVHDTHRLAATAATKTLQQFFPGSDGGPNLNVAEVVDIAKAIAKHLETNASSVADRKNLSQEESEKRVLRVLRQCLAALSGLAELSLRLDVDEAQTAAVREQLSASFSFAMRYMKNKDERLQRSAYRCVTTALQHRDKWLVQETKVGKAVLSAFRDRTASNYPAIWGLVLQYFGVSSSDSAPTAAATVLKKWLFPQFWDFLANGCFGAQDVAFTALVPLVGKLPLDFVHDGPGAADDKLTTSSIFIFKFVRTLLLGCGIQLQALPHSSKHVDLFVCSDFADVPSSKLALDCILCACNCLVVTARRLRADGRAWQATGTMRSDDHDQINSSSNCFTQAVYAMLSAYLQLGTLGSSQGLLPNQASQLRSVMTLLLNEAVGDVEDAKPTLVLDCLDGCLRKFSGAGQDYVQGIAPANLSNLLEQSHLLLHVDSGESTNAGYYSTAAILHWLCVHIGTLLSTHAAILVALEGADQEADGVLAKASAVAEVLLESALEALRMLPKSNDSVLQAADLDASITSQFQYMVYGLHQLLPCSAVDDMRSATLLPRMTKAVNFAVEAWHLSEQVDWSQLKVQEFKWPTPPVNVEEMSSVLLAAETPSQFVCDAVFTVLVAVTSTSTAPTKPEALLKELQTMATQNRSLGLRELLEKRPAATNACVEVLSHIADAAGIDTVRYAATSLPALASVVEALTYSFAAPASRKNSFAFSRCSPLAFAQLLKLFVPESGELLKTSVGKKIQLNFETTLKFCVEQLEQFASKVACLNLDAEACTSLDLHAEEVIHFLRFFAATYKQIQLRLDSNGGIPALFNVCCRGCSSLLLMVSHCSPPDRGTLSSARKQRSNTIDDSFLFGSLFSRQLVIKKGTRDAAETVLTCIDDVLIEAQIEMAQFWTETTFLNHGLAGVVAFTNSVLGSQAHKGHSVSSWFLASTIIGILDAIVGASGFTPVSVALDDIDLLCDSHWEQQRRRRDPTSLQTWLYYCEVFALLVHMRSLEFLWMAFQSQSRRAEGSKMPDKAFCALLCEFQYALADAQREASVAAAASLSSLIAPASDPLEHSIAGGDTTAWSVATTASLKDLAHMQSSLLNSFIEGDMNHQYEGLHLGRLVTLVGEKCCSAARAWGSATHATTTVSTVWRKCHVPNGAWEPLTSLMQNVFPLQNSNNWQFVQHFFGAPARTVLESALESQVVAVREAAVSTSPINTRAPPRNSADPAVASVDGTASPADIYKSLSNDEKISLSIALKQMAAEDEDDSSDDDDDGDEDEQELPYDGDIMKAMQAQDRAAIRLLMAHRDKQQSLKTAREQKTHVRNKKPKQPSISPASPHTPRNSVFAQNEIALYRGRDGKVQLVRIVGVHTDGGEEPYYSITWGGRDQSQIRQTVALRLSRIPADLEVLANTSSTDAAVSPKKTDAVASTTRDPIEIRLPQGIVASPLSIREAHQLRKLQQLIVELCCDVCGATSWFHDVEGVGLVSIILRHAVAYLNATTHGGPDPGPLVRAITAGTSAAVENLKSESSRQLQLAAIELSATLNFMQTASSPTRNLIGDATAARTLLQLALSSLPGMLSGEADGEDYQIMLSAATFVASVLSVWSHELQSNSEAPNSSSDGNNPRLMETLIKRISTGFNTFMQTTVSAGNEFTADEPAQSSIIGFSFATASLQHQRLAVASLRSMSREHRLYVTLRSGLRATSALSADAWDRQVLHKLLHVTPSLCFERHESSAGAWPALPLLHDWILNFDHEASRADGAAAWTPGAARVKLVDHLFVALFSSSSALAEASACVYHDAISNALCVNTEHDDSDDEDDIVEANLSFVRNLDVVRQCRFLLGTPRCGLIPCVHCSSSNDRDIDARVLNLTRRSLTFQRGFLLTYMLLLHTLRSCNKLSDRQALCGLSEVHHFVECVLDFCFRIVLVDVGKVRLSGSSKVLRPARSVSSLYSLECHVVACLTLFATEEVSCLQHAFECSCARLRCEYGSRGSGWDLRWRKFHFPRQARHPVSVRTSINNR